MSAPETVHVTYRNIDGVHVFTSQDVRGLYVADRDLRAAYEAVPEALHQLFKYRKIEAAYHPVMTTEEFLRFVGTDDHGEIPHPSVIQAQNVGYSRAA